MANPILPKHNNTAGTVPAAASLVTNELAINTADAIAYVKHSDGTVKQIVDPTKAPLASPALTGTPTAPTAAPGTSTTQLATTAFVTAADNLKAPLASPAFTGTPTAPTATAGTSTTQLATTAFVTAADNLKVDRDSTTGAALLPTGTSAQRPAAGAGKLRFNTDLAKFEGHNGTAWGSLGGATGGGNDAVFYTNGQTVTTNYTIPTGQNAMSAGPITIADGVTVTVSDGSVWTIV
jgi:hypothetical protein